jgi:hypothetical protein
MKGHYPNLGPKPPTADHPSRHRSAHHSDSSGAHVRGTHHHLSNAHHTADAEGGEAEDHELQMSEHAPGPGADMTRPAHGSVDRGDSMPGGAMQTADEDETA